MAMVIRAPRRPVRRAGERSRSADCRASRDGYDLVDLGPQAQDKAGDPVILWGEVCP